MRWQREPSTLPAPTLFQKNSEVNKVVKEEDWRNCRPISKSTSFRRSSTVETASSSTPPTPLPSLSPATARTNTLQYNEIPKKKSVPPKPSIIRSSSLFQHTPSTWFGGKDNVAKEEDWRNTRLSSTNNFKRTLTADSVGIISLKRSSTIDTGNSIPDLFSRLPLRTVSRGRSRNVSPDAADANDSAQRSKSLSKKSRSKSRQGRHENPTSDSWPPGTSKNGKSTCINKTSKSTSGRGSVSNHDLSDRSGLSRSSKHCTRGRSRSSNRKQDSCQSTRSGSVSRESKCGSSQMAPRHKNHDRSGLSRSSARGRSRSSNRKKDDCQSIKTRSVSRGSQRDLTNMTPRHETKLRVANMPYVYQHDREGRYTGEINDYGQPNGKGTIRYDDGTTFTGRWTNGSLEETKAIAAPKPGKFRGRR